MSSRVARYQLLLAVSSLLVSACFGFVGKELTLRTRNAHLPLRYASPINNGDNQGSYSALKEEAKSKTLYEILGAPATATREELKKCYVKKAKLSHPDAQIANAGSNNTITDKLDFNEIAQAWNILGDDKLRRRYDRELRAQAFSESAQRFANENLERAVPAMANMVDNFAAPFLRRTTATTWAVGQAVAKEVSSHENVELSDTWKKAVQAGQEVGRFMDGVDLKEKSKDLQSQAQDQLKRGTEIEDELDALTERRLLATLQSKDFFLSSDEATDVLNRLSIESENPTLLGRAMMRNTIEQEIRLLQVAEAKFSEKLKEYEATDKEWNTLLNKQDEAKMNLSKHKMEEMEARRALERAQRQVSEAKSQLLTSTNALRGIEQSVRKNAFEMDRMTSTLSQKQEKVRASLKKKVDQARGGMEVEYLTEDDLTALRRREIQLVGEQNQTRRKATQLQTEAESLKKQADNAEPVNGQQGEE
ncbi:unnamed protein product [Cylindrotheca closterium]|uniref:J domain-containing protein n=1 Tax=Cylindrotheca closterium TaxID=2856 RepID=A0AAD2FFZ2_9STRA|nr:unnamed protein product [Cylindrotheca closterium]